MLVLALGLVALARRDAASSSGEGALEPNGRGLQLLGGREAILLDQSERARRAARGRALTLYRLLRVAALEHPASSEGGQRLGGRAVALATAVLARDLAEARALRGELDRVRLQRSTLPPVSDETVRGEAAPVPLPAPGPAFIRPVAGALVTPFGVGRDGTTGAWLFRAAASFAVKPGEIVYSPADGRIARVAESVAGGVAVVLTHALGGPASGAGAVAGTGWTVVLSGLASVAVAPGEMVRRGDALGTARRAPGATVRIETWRGRSPVDPAAVLRAR